MASQSTSTRPGQPTGKGDTPPRAGNGQDASDTALDGIGRLPGATLAETAYGRLRKDIVRGTLSPGEKLRVEHLRDAYKIGSSPLREALSRLTSSKLVVARGQQGFYVAPVSVADLLDLTKVRVWAHTMALRSSMAYGDRDWEARLVAALHRITGRPSDMGTELWDQYHTELHDALIAACRSPNLIEHCANLQDLSDRYRWLSLKQSKGGRDAQAEHEAMVKAVLARDASSASAMIEEHFIRTTEILLNGSEMQGSTTLLIARLRDEIRAALPAP